MDDDLRIGRDWTQDGDQIFLRAQQHLAAFDTALSATELELAHHDFTVAGQMYLTGAIQYQRGSDAVAVAAPGFSSSEELIRHLEGHLLSEAVAAFEVSANRAPRDNPRLGEVDRAHTLALELRERFSHAVPELFTRQAAPTIPDSASRGH